jgi:hypothetical protein
MSKPGTTVGLAVLVALAQLKSERRQATADDVARAGGVYQNATFALQRFWDSTRPTD